MQIYGVEHVQNKNKQKTKNLNKAAQDVEESSKRGLQLTKDSCLVYNSTCLLPSTLSLNPLSFLSFPSICQFLEQLIPVTQ